MFDKFKHIIQMCTRGLSYAGMAFIFPMMLLTTLDATGRDLISRPVRGAFEVSSLILSIFILLGLAYAQQMKDHVRVTILLDRLPVRASCVINMLTTLLCMFIVGVMAWQGVVVAYESSSVTDMLRIPQFPFRLLVTVAGVLLFLEFLCDLVDEGRRFMA